MAMTPHDPSGGGAFPFASSVPSAALPHQDALPLLRPSAVRLVRGAPERPIGLSYQTNSPCRRLLGSHPLRLHEPKALLRVGEKNPVAFVNSLLADTHRPIAQSPRLLPGGLRLSV